MPVINNSMRSSTHKSRPEYHIRLICDDWLNNIWVLDRIILKIGVLDDDEGGGGVLEAGAEGGAFALVDFVVVGVDAGVGGGEFLEDGPGAVFGAVVHDDEFGDVAHKEKSFADRVMFWRADKSATPAPVAVGSDATPIDPAAEAERISKLTGGKTVIIGSDDVAATIAWLDGANEVASYEVQS